MKKGADDSNGDVLVVDDDEVVRGMICWLLEDAGYTVRQAGDGREALVALAEREPDCMVLDLMMPGIDGQTVLRERRQAMIAADTRVIILTAKDSRADEVFCWEHDADEFLTKPFDGERLVRLVGELMHLTADELVYRRQTGLAEARRLDSLDSTFRHKR
jgi:DNA-binding response OmpR family regulator